MGKRPFLHSLVSILLLVLLLFSFSPAIAISAEGSDSDPVNLDEPVMQHPVYGPNGENTECETYKVTLITGDRVTVTIDGEGNRSIGILSSDNHTEDDFLIIDQPAVTGEMLDGEPVMHTYVYPKDINLGVFDQELFNIDYLVDEHYYEMPGIPVLVVDSPAASGPSSGMMLMAMDVADEVSVYDDMHMTAARIDTETAAEAFAVLDSQESVEKVWLDKKVKVSLTDSLPLIGTPEIWDSGYTGDGVTIAVLDTGIDATHPTLDDMDDDPGTTDPKVLYHVDFTDDNDPTDMYGHGTHCASIAAGTGSGSVTNILQNPGFEDGNASWNTSLGAATYSATIETNVSGDYSMKGIETDAGSLGRLYQDVTAYMTPGKYYRIGGWMKTENADCYLSMQMCHVEINGTTPIDGYIGNAPLISGTNDWAYYESPWFQMTEMPASCVATWFLFDFNAGTGTAWFDDLFLYELPENVNGVAPGAHLYNVKVLNHTGVGYDSWIINGINYAVLGPDGIADTGDEADIINMSLGSGPGDGTEPLSQAVNWASSQGVVMALSAGNSGDEYFTIGMPGVASDVITVGATDKGDKIASFSSRGPTLDFRVKPDVCAPGVAIVAARASGTSMGNVVNDLYTSAGGTSMAAPHVAGAAALILEADAPRPAGWDDPRFVKTSLMSNAIDLGLDVYTQGSGRISLPDSVTPTILVDPPTVNFGVQSGAFSCTQQYTFYNMDETAHTLDLSSVLTEIVYGTDYSGTVTLQPSSIEVPAGGSASVDMTVDTTGISKGIFSGMVSADIDTGGAVQAIFGFSVLNLLTVNKIDMNGNPGVGHYVSVFADAEYPMSMMQSGVTDETGAAYFFVSDDTYQVLSGILLDGSVRTSAVPDSLPVANEALGDYNGATVWVFDEVTVSGDASITLDDRTTVPIDFDPNEANQIIAEKSSYFTYQGTNIGINARTLWKYPVNTVVYVSPTTTWKSNYTYSYYPAQYHNADMLVTPEWSKLRYGLDTVPATPVTFTADPAATATRVTEYRTYRGDERARMIQWAISPPTGTDVSYYWPMKVPIVRTETLSADPVGYREIYFVEKEPETWRFESSYHYVYAAGGTFGATKGAHPFTSGIWYTYIDDEHSFRLFGTPCSDNYGNRFTNSTLQSSGNLDMTMNGNPFLNVALPNGYFSIGIDMTGYPELGITIDGLSGQDFPASTETVLQLQTDPLYDRQIPQNHLIIDPGSMNLYNEVLYGEIPLLFFAYDDTAITGTTLEYSTDDGTTWLPVTLTLDNEFTGGKSYTASINVYNGRFLSFRMYVEDTQGNSADYTVMQGVPLISSMNYAPADGAALPPGVVDFDWDDIQGATGYHIQIDTVPTFDSGTLIETDTAASAYSATFDTIETYYWRVKAYYAGGETSYNDPLRFLISNAVVPITTDISYDSDPCIYMMQDGTLWMVWGRGGTIWIKTSTDDGASWSAGTSYYFGSSCYEPQLIQTSSGRLILAYESYQSGSSQIWYVTSDDNGVSWSTAAQVTSESHNFSPDIMAEADGTVWILWDSYLSGNNDIWYVKSPDGGNTWTSAVQLTTDLSPDWSPDIIQTPDGRIRVTWHSLMSGNRDLWTITSSDNGGTWSVPEQLTFDTSSQINATTALTADGTLWLGWETYGSGPSDIWYMTSIDNGDTWGDPIQFTRFVGDDGYPSLCPLTSDTPIIAWESDRSGNYDIWIGVPGVKEDTVLVPYVAEAWHDPGPNPDTDETVTIIARLHDETGITGAKALFHAGGVQQPDLVLHNDGTNGDKIAGDDLWAVEISGTLSAGVQYLYEIQVTDMEDNTVTVPSGGVLFTVQNPWTPVNDILFVLDTTQLYYAQDFGPQYTAALDAAGTAYDTWDVSVRGVPRPDELADYRMVIWGVPGFTYYSALAPGIGYAGYNHVPDGHEAVHSITQYLDAGGDMMISCEWAASSYASDPFLTNYLHATYQGSPTLFGVQGVFSDPITSGMALPLTGCNGNEINPTGPALTILTYDPAATVPATEVQALPDTMAYVFEINDGMMRPDETGVNGIISSGTAGLRVDTGTYKLVFLAFDFATIGDETGRNELMANIVDWLASGQQQTVTGDANGDGVVTVYDITAVARVILELDLESPGSDADGNGTVNVMDITKIARIILGLDPS